MFEKSKYLNKICWSFDKSSNPYPLILIDNFLKTEIYKEIAEKFPSLKIFKNNGDIEGNNTQIRIGFSDFSQKLDLCWKELGSYFLNEDFFYNFCEFFKDDIKHWYPKIYSRLKNKNLKIGIQGIDNFDDCDVLLDFQVGVNTPVKKVTSVRGPHLDNQKSLYTALCYLKDNDDITDSGHFTAYKLKPFRLISLGSSRSVNLSDVSNYKEIKYKSNRLVTFLNTKKSIHGVTQRELTDKVRKFFAFNAVYKEQLYKMSFLSRVTNRVKIFFDKKK
jgi:hypothetical protein